MTFLSRTALHERIWSEPVRKVAQAFGVSDVWLRKVCQGADIPLPERGYWARVRAGQAVKPSPLPQRGPGKSDDVEVGPRNPWGRRHTEPDLGEPELREPVFEEPIEAVRARVEARLGKVRYERGFSATHPLIRSILSDEQKRRLTPTDAPWRLTSCSPIFSSAFEQRRLKILNCLFIALQKFGAHPWVNGDTARNLGVEVGDQRVGFRLDHPSAKPDRFGEWHTRGGWADELKLTLDGGGRSWSDTEDHGLDAYLGEIAVELIVAGEVAYRARAHAAWLWALKRREEIREEQVRRRIEAEREARKARIAAEKARRVALAGMAADLRAADDIRALVLRVVERRGEVEAGVPAWKDWALGVAARLDPTARMIIEADGSARLEEVDWAALDSAQAESKAVDG